MTKKAITLEEYYWIEPVYEYGYHQPDGCKVRMGDCPTKEGAEKVVKNMIDFCVESKPAGRCRACVPHSVSNSYGFCRNKAIKGGYCGKHQNLVKEEI